ncbi:hypothetical protein NBRC116602_13640 [Hyphomicrobiales bacterium 4NK60-0047b]
MPEKQNICKIRKLNRDKSPKSRVERLTAENGKTMVQRAEGAVIRHDQRPENEVSMPSPSDQDEKSTVKGDKTLEDRFGQLKDQMDTIQESKANETPERDGNAIGKAMRMGTEFVVSVLVGAFLGWQFDTWFDTKPLWLILFMLFGFGAGVNNVLRLAKKEQETGLMDEKDQDQ